MKKSVGFIVIKSVNELKALVEKILGLLFFVETGW